MEKQTFGALFKQASARSREWRFIGLFVLGILAVLTMLLPFIALTGYCVYLGIAAKQQGTEYPFQILLWAIPLGLILYIAAAWLGAAIFSGIGHEALEESPVRAGRAFRGGFARFLTVLYPLPWVIGAGIASGVLRGAANLAAPGAGALIAIPLALAVNVVTMFMYAGVASEAPGIGISELYSRVFRAVKNGWGRMLCGHLVIVLIMFAILAFFYLPSGVLIAAAIARDSVKMLLIGGSVIAVLLVLVMLISLRLWVLQSCFSVYLYTDASRVDEAPAAAPEFPVEPPAPEA